MRWRSSLSEATSLARAIEECVEQLEKHIATGIDRIIFVPYRYENEQVEALANEIIPKLKAKMA